MRGMKAGLVDVPAPSSMAPLCFAYGVASLPVANRPMREWLKDRCREAGLDPVSEVPEGDRAVFVRTDAWVSASSLRALAEGSSDGCVVDSSGEPLAWSGSSAHVPAEGERRSSGEGEFLVRFPWQLLDLNQAVLAEMTEPAQAGTVESGTTVNGVLSVGAGSVVLPGVYIEGTVLIGRDCKIGPNCYLRGSTSVGDGCHIGQAVEVKNSIVMDGTSMGHLSYCGDSVVGRDVNFGAGTITANFRHDGSNHRSAVDGELIDTGRRKLGAVVGDRVHTGIHTSIYPGRKLWPDTSTRPGEVVRKDLRSDSV